MGRGCEPQNLVAVIQGAGQIVGDIFSEAERVNHFDAEQRAYYEQTTTNHFGLGPKNSGRSAWDIIAVRSKKAVKPALADDRLYARPPERSSSKFYNDVDQKITG